MPKVDLNAKFVQSVKPQKKREEYFDSAIPGFCLRVSERGHKTWGVYYRTHDKLHRMALGSVDERSLKEARNAAREVLRSAFDDIDPLEHKKQERSADTFDYLANEYLERHAKPKKRSWQEDERIINTDLLPAFGGMKAKDVTRRDIRALLERKAKTAPIMAIRIRATLRKMYNWGVQNDIVEQNPVHLVPLPAKNRQRDRVLTEEEIKSIWKALDAEGTTSKAHRKRQRITAASLKLRLLTAQRGGEVMNMEWSEIDGDWWTIPKEKTKNGLSHRVPLSPFAKRIIDEVKAICEGPEKKPLPQYLFPSPSGDAPMTSPGKAIQRIQVATGIEFRGHDLRRTAASMMTGMGIPRLTVSKILNHVESGVTSVYDRHSYDIEKRKALEDWARKLIMIVSDLKEVKTEA